MLPQRPFEKALVVLRLRKNSTNRQIKIANLPLIQYIFYIYITHMYFESSTWQYLFTQCIQ